MNNTTLWVGEGVKQLELPSLAGGSVKWHYFENWHPWWVMYCAFNLPLLGYMGQNFPLLLKLVQVRFFLLAASELWTTLKDKYRLCHWLWIVVMLGSVEPGPLNHTSLFKGLIDPAQISIHKVSNSELWPRYHLLLFPWLCTSVFSPTVTFWCRQSGSINTNG